MHPAVVPHSPPAGHRHKAALKASHVASQCQQACGLLQVALTHGSNTPCKLLHLHEKHVRQAEVTINTRLPNRRVFLFCSPSSGTNASICPVESRYTLRCLLLHQPQHVPAAAAACVPGP